MQVLKRNFKRKKQSFSSKINRVFFYVYYFLFLKRKAEKLFVEELDFSGTLKPDHKFSNINDPQALREAKEFSPDLILVFGTSLLRKKWFELEIPIVNSHLGIIPRYRGWMSWFWAILEEKFDSVGISIHYVTKIADGGELILQDYIDISKLEKIDLPHLLFAVTLLVNENIAPAIAKIQKSEKTDLDFDTYGYVRKYPHYFEPGITDYFKFASLTRKLNRKR
jgi:methionyl-tRNA formyltransferase